MVQVFSPSPRAMQAGQIGQSLGLGVAKNNPDPQQLVQRGMLQDAMSQLPQNASYIDLLKTIGPQLMTTPGGSQLLAELGPILQKEAQGRAGLSYLNQNQPGAPGAQGAGTPGQPGATGQPSQTPKQEVTPGGEAYSRNPQPPMGKEGTYPKMSALPEPMPLMTPQEQQQKVQQYMAQSMAQGIPADVVAAQNLVQNEQAQRMQYNQQIEKERNTREEKQQQQSQRMLTRFSRANQNASEDDRVVFEKFANEAKDAANENDAYQYARAKYNQFDNARNGLVRQADLPGFAEKMYRQTMGTYKSKENVIKDLQPNLKKLKDLGLENEARAILSNDVGLGMEDTELAMYPPSKEESMMYNKFSSNPQKKKVDMLFSDEYLRFPGEESALDPNAFVTFKDNVANILEKNPQTNLVALRGVLNQDKKYAWTDVSKALSELMEEGRFVPDAIQEQQWNVVKSPPIPGMGALFREFWTGTK